jgi:hypothetical protein
VQPAPVIVPAPVVVAPPVVVAHPIYRPPVVGFGYGRFHGHSHFYVRGCW